MTFTLFFYASAALVLALLAGVFLAFSDFIMRSLRAASPEAGIEAMQQINREVYRSVFLAAFLAMAPISAIVIGHALFYVDGPAAYWLAAGGAVYLSGTFLVTLLGNVPMNQRLDPMTIGQVDTEAYWECYVSGWTRYNHLRTLAAGVSAACLLVGCLMLV